MGYNKSKAKTGTKPHSQTTTPPAKTYAELFWGAGKGRGNRRSHLAIIMIRLRRGSYESGF
jgi:hypothetical protein